jgi:hypothetical protein
LPVFDFVVNFFYMIYVPTELPLAIQWHGFELPPRKGLQRKAHRICIGKSEDLERKARFFAAMPQKMRPKAVAFR